MGTIVRLDSANNLELRRLRAAYNLTLAQIEDLTGGSHTLVSAWLSDPESPTFRRMRPSALRLLKLELGLEKPGFRHLIREANKLRGEIQASR